MKCVGYESFVSKKGQNWTNFYYLEDVVSSTGSGQSGQSILLPGSRVFDVGVDYEPVYRVFNGGRASVQDLYPVGDTNDFVDKKGVK